MLEKNICDILSVQRDPIQSYTVSVMNESQNTLNKYEFIVQEYEVLVFCCWFYETQSGLHKSFWRNVGIITKFSFWY